MTVNRSNLVWMDLEMSGLDPDRETILEIATIITDGDLNIIAEGPSIVIHQPDEVLDNMDEWCTQHHAQSGLTANVRNSLISMREAERQTLRFIKKYVPEKTSPLCGNSIHQDRRFLVRYMQELEAFVHYRNIDVSTIKELARRWYPNIQAPIKQAEHLALADVRESIREMAFYRDKLFR
ncbi:oligoribonuclease [Mariprofundus ferrinatatus]|uniref:Oligoribonuclease n=1 Tax=Mariprofundus ferrinatatus TaxID=1921087 RepID=A0A2K8L513_9PROT|nr:oligoribonuclease [Mariprofundus ferrinatatus]ATX81329.1 oligoribonuclease [Mariprofundus ferrinatatus]